MAFSIEHTTEKWILGFEFVIHIDSFWYTKWMQDRTQGIGGDQREAGGSSTLSAQFSCKLKGAVK